MHVLIVEDDPLMTDLIATLVRQLAPTAEVHRADTVAGAVELWWRLRPAVIICDWQLSGTETGDELVQTVRRRGDKATILMVTGQSSRQWVERMIRLGVDNYITKPFTPAALLERLRPYMSTQPAQADSAPVPIADWLADIDAVLEEIPDRAARFAATDNYETLRSLSAVELEHKWQAHAGLTERLVRSANQMLYRGSGRSISVLRDAIAVMGIDQAVNLAFALSVGNPEPYPSKTLAAVQARLAEQSRRVAETASDLARQVGRDSALAYTAGLLHNLGEMTVLAAIAWYDEHYRAVEGQSVERLITRWGPEYGNRLRVRWRLPLQLRELMGATHRLPDDHRTQDMLLMRLAGMLGQNEAVSEEMKRLARQAGLSEYALTRRQLPGNGPR